jgi:hypothetical protein
MKYFNSIKKGINDLRLLIFSVKAEVKKKWMMKSISLFVKEAQLLWIRKQDDSIEGMKYKEVTE